MRNARRNRQWRWRTLAGLSVAASLAATSADAFAQAGRETATDQSGTSVDCYGLDIDFRFVADRYKEPWLTNSAQPFNFANLFTFDLIDKVRPQVAYARVDSTAGKTNLRISFFSRENDLIHQKSLKDSSVECGSGGAAITYSYFLHGGDSFGGSNRRVTVSFLQRDKIARVSSKVELDSRWLVFRSSKETRETWAEFSRYPGKTE